MLTEALATPVSFLLWVAGIYLAVELLMVLFSLLAVFITPYDVDEENDLDE